MLLALALTAACARGKSAAPPASPATPPTPRALQALGDPAAGTTLDVLAALAAASPRSAYDVAAAADALGGGVEAALAFVRDRVRYEAYAGALRGARGTLMARAGNSYDRAALLAALLARGGREVRYARARLSDDQARALVSSMFAAARSPRDPPPAAAQDAARAVATGLGEFDQVLFGRWLAAADIVRRALERDRIGMGDQRLLSMQALADEAADHLYVEYREGDRWIPLDPSVDGGGPGDRLADPVETLPTIPDALHHRVAIRVRVERRAGGQLSVDDALRYEAPAADLYGTAVTLTHRLLSNDPWRVAPVIQVGDQILTGHAFGDQSAGEIVGSRVGRLLGARGPGPGEVTAVWLQFDFVDPTGQAESVRREVFDRIGVAARLDGREATAPLAPLVTLLGVPAPLIHTYGLAIASGAVHPGTGSALARHAQGLATARSLLASRAQRGGPFTEDEVQRVVGALAPAVPPALGALAEAFQTLSTAGLPFSAGADAYLYAPTPRLTIASIGFTVAPDGATIASGLSIDLRRNVLRAVSERAPAAVAAWANVRRGLYDAVLEHVLVGAGAGHGGVEGDLSSAVGILDEAQRRGIGVAVVADGAALQRIGAPEPVKARMRAALADGVVLVTPAQALPAGGARRLGWWRIDLRNGDALAVMDDGLHTSSEQQLVKRRQAEATLWALYEKWVVAFFGGNPVHQEIARGYAMAFYQMGIHAGAGPSPWPLVVSVSGLAALVAFLLGWWARGTQVPPPPPPAPPRSQ